MSQALKFDTLLDDASKLITLQERRRERLTTRLGSLMMKRKTVSKQQSPLYSLRKVFAKSPFEYLGQATAQFNYTSATSVGNIRLSGKIVPDAEQDFLQFVQALKSQRVKNLRLQLKDLTIMSYKAFWGLVKLAKSARRRGTTVEIIGINPIILDLMNGHGVTKYFSLQVAENSNRVQGYYGRKTSHFRELAA